MIFQTDFVTKANTQSSVSTLTSIVESMHSANLGHDIIRISYTLPEVKWLVGGPALVRQPLCSLTLGYWRHQVINHLSNGLDGDGDGDGERERERERE